VPTNLLGHPDAPSLRFVLTVNEQQRSGSGVFRIVTLVEVWTDGLVLRWVESPRSPDAPARVEMTVGPQVADDVGTRYDLRRSSGGGASERLEMQVTVEPTPPPEAGELRIQWPEGEHTVVPLPRT
jgi:hypothetical protein